LLLVEQKAEFICAEIALQTINEGIYSEGMTSHLMQRKVKTPAACGRHPLF
jgi:hypothetical protein